MLKQGMLFRLKKDSEDVVLVVPKELQEKALQWHHYIPSAAHQGVACTKAKLKKKFWFHLPRDVAEYMLTCDVCSRIKDQGVWESTTVRVTCRGSDGTCPHRLLGSIA